MGSLAIFLNFFFIKLNQEKQMQHLRNKCYKNVQFYYIKVEIL